MTEENNLDRMSKPNKRPLPKEWVGLTDEEIDGLWEMARVFAPPKHFYLLVEAKLKEKNHG
jgi:hypothetical protein